MSSSVRLHVDRILPFLKSRIQLLGMKALLVLAYLITETNNHMIVGSKGKDLRLNVLGVFLVNGN